MKTLLNTKDVANALAKDEYANWSQNGALALAEYLEAVSYTHLTLPTKA